MFVVVCCLVFTVAIDLILAFVPLSLFTVLLIFRFFFTLLYLNRFNTKVSEFAIQLNIQIERKKSEQQQMQGAKGAGHILFGWNFEEFVKL